MSPPTLTVAVVQPTCLPGDLAANALAHADAVRAAASRVVVFPEMSLTGYELDAPPVEPTTAVLGPIVEACAETGSIALVGAAVRSAAGAHIATLAIDAAVADVAYTKAFLGDDEAAAFVPGDGPRAIDVDGWRIGLGICKDTRIDAHIDATSELGIDLYAAGLVHRPGEVDELDDRAARFRARLAIPIAFASAAGRAGSDYPETAGHSAIWDADGRVLARCGSGSDEIGRARLTR